VPRPGLAAALLGGSLVALVVLVGIAYLTLGPGTGPVRPAVAQAAAVPIPSPRPPIRLAAVQATADAVFTLTPGALLPATPPTKPTAAPPAGSPAPAKPAQIPPTATSSATPTPLYSPTPEPTEPPTRTPTVTRTPTATPTETPTNTPNPLPSPCDAKIAVPRLGVGSGFFVTFTHEVAGELAVTWPAEGGRILLYQERPAGLGDGQSGTIEGVPSVQAIAQGTGGGGTLNLPNREPGPYTVELFNASANPVGPDEATVHYWTYGHCP